MLKDKIRKNALQHATSPDRLDTMIKVVQPLGFMAAMVLGAAVVALSTWSVAATAPVKVRGSGILLTEGHLISVAARGSGIVTRQMVQTGDVVAAGDVLAELTNVATEAAIDRAARAETAAGEAYDRAREAAERLNRERETALSLAEAQQDTREADALAEVTRQGEALARQRDLLERGLATRPTVMALQTALAAAREAHAAALAERAARRAAHRGAVERTRLAIEQDRRAFHEARAVHKALKGEYQAARTIVATADGQVVEAVSWIGEGVVPNQRLFSLMATQGAQHDAAPLTGVIYVPPKSAARIRKNQAVELIPASVDKERFGYVRGTVISVAAVPSSREALMDRLQNADMASALTQNGPVSAVTVALERDPQSPSGLQWSTAGPDFTIAPGTVAEASFVVDRKRLIAFVLPRLQRVLPAVSTAEAAPVSGPVK